MKVPKVHRVQAQRKFAQGAYVPAQLVPATSNTHTDPKKDRVERKDVICNRTSAKIFLDFVSLERHHRHEKLRVVVQRLEDTDEYESITQSVEDLPKQVVKTKSVHKENVSKRNVVSAGKQLANKCRKTKDAPKLNMTLRSRGSGKKRVSNVSLSTKRKVKPRKSSLKRRQLFKNTRCDFTSDDSIPLCYMRTDTAQVNPPKVNGDASLGSPVPKRKTFKKPVENDKPSIIKKKRKISRSLGEVAVNRENEQNNITKKRQITKSPVVKKRNRASLAEIKKNKATQKRSSNGWNAVAPQKIQELNVMVEMSTDVATDVSVTSDVEQSSVSNGRRSPNLGSQVVRNNDKPSKGKSLARLIKQPTVTLTQATSPHKLPSVSETTQSTTNADLCFDVISVASSVEDPKPGPSGLTNRNTTGNRSLSVISDWSRDTVIIDRLPIVSITQCEASKSLYYNSNQITNWLDENGESQDSENGDSPVPCPAREWVTLKDVVDAFKQDVSRRCNNCQQCNRVTKLFRLSSLLKKQRSIECTDEELEYDRPAQTTNVEDNSNVVSSGKGNRHLYLELLPSHPHLMIKVQIQNLHGKQVLSARLIPRSDAKISEELRLVEHEYLVDQLTNMLLTQLNIHPPNATNNVPKPQREKRHDASGSSRPSFPKGVESAQQVDAPVFYPTPQEFMDPIEYFEKISPYASKFGLCKVVPPSKFQPKCNINDELSFDPCNQYISRLYSRWGPAAREICTMKACLTSANSNLNKIPTLEGIELNIAKLYHGVQRCGGLEKLIYKKRWGRVAEDMGLPKMAKLERKLEHIYMKYLLPYDTLGHKERQDLIRRVEKCWNRRNQKMLDRATNPLHRQKRLLGESDTSEDESEEEPAITTVLKEAEDCITSSNTINLEKFKKIASIVLDNYFRSPTTPPTPSEVEKEYWRLVLLGTEHICVNTASVDTGEEGYGFSKNPPDPYSRHPWNLKMLSQNSGNVLRSLGGVAGLTMPTLHVGMVYSTSCWHRDPHGLPWIEYMHEGPQKIWYGIPEEQGRKFRSALEALCPTYCQNKSIWLPSDITMVPPNLLLEHNISLSRVEQQPGEYIIVFPKAYSCSICTGYTISESVYFATNSWLNCVHEVFQELRDSCEPTMFPLDQLLIAIADDQRTPLSVLQQVHATLSTIITDEIDYRSLLTEKNMTVVTAMNGEQLKQKRRTGAWNFEECEICRMSLYMSKVTGLTGKNSAVCVRHANRILNTPANIKLQPEGHMWIYITTERLTSLLGEVDKRLSTQRR